MDNIYNYLCLCLGKKDGNDNEDERSNRVDNIIDDFIDIKEDVVDLVDDIKNTNFGSWFNYSIPKTM